jgi:O-antigen ligase
MLIVGGTEGTDIPYSPFGGEAWLLSRVGRRFAYAFLLLQVALRPRQVLAPVFRNPPVFAFVAIAGLSLLWSAGASGSQLTVVFQFLMATLLGCYLAGRYGTDELFDLVAVVFGIITVLSLVFVFAVPELGTLDGTVTGRWRGVFTQRNQLGHTMWRAILIFGLMAWPGTRWRGLALMGLAGSALLLVGSQSLTAWVVFGGLAVFLPTVILLNQFREKSALLLVALFLLLAFLLVVVGYWESVLEILGKDETLTGRTGIWAASWQQILQRPWLGFGFKVFWVPGNTPVEVFGITGWEAPNAHNGYLDLLLDVGVVGLAVFLIGYAVAVWRVWRRYSLGGMDVAGLWSMGFLVSLAVANTTTSTFYGNYLTWALFIVAATIPLAREELTRRGG